MTKYIDENGLTDIYNNMQDQFISKYDGKYNLATINGKELFYEADKDGIVVNGKSNIEIDGYKQIYDNIDFYELKHYNEFQYSRFNGNDKTFYSLNFNYEEIPYDGTRLNRGVSFFLDFVSLNTSLNEKGKELYEYFSSDTAKAYTYLFFVSDRNHTLGGSVYAFEYNYDNDVEITEKGINVNGTITGRKAAGARQNSGTYNLGIRKFNEEEYSVNLHHTFTFEARNALILSSLEPFIVFPSYSNILTEHPEIFKYYVEAQNENGNFYTNINLLEADKIITLGNVKTINGESIIGQGDLGINSSGITDAPNDGKLYGRKDGAWVEIVIPDAFAIVN